MATNREHWQETHQKLAERFATEADHQDALAKSKKGGAAMFMAMHKAAGLAAGVESPHSQYAEALNKEAGLHEANAADLRAHEEYHRDAVDKCGKAMDSDLTKLQPTRIHATIPDHPLYRAVPRTGAPAPGSVTKVDIEAERILPDVSDERFYI
jgi:hypothetical protein